MSDPYEQILEGGAELLRRLSPHESGGDHCVEAADAVNDFLTTGVIAPVVAGFAVTYRLHRDVLAGFERISLENAITAVGRMGHGHHIVLRATRTRPRGGETTHHYIVLANIRGNPVLIDAYGHMVIQRQDRMLEYFQTLIGPSYLEYAANGFDVTVNDPLSLDFPDL